jgi:hypothetical protein
MASIYLNANLRLIFAFRERQELGAAQPFPYKAMVEGRVECKSQDKARVPGLSVNFFILRKLNLAPRKKWLVAQNVMTIMRRFLFCCSIIIIIIIKTSNHLHHQLLLCLSDKTSLLHPEEEARGKDDGTYVW